LAQEDVNTRWQIYQKLCEINFTGESK